MTHNEKSIEKSDDLLADEGWTEQQKYHRLVALGDKYPWPLTLKQSMCPTEIRLKGQVGGSE